MDMTREHTTRRAPLATSFGRQVRRGGSVRDTALSAVLHVAVLALIIWGGGREFVDATRGPGDDLRRGGGGGGGGLRAFAMFTAPGHAAPPPAPTSTPTPITVPVETPTTIPEPAAQPAPAPVTTPPEGQGAGPGAGTGTGPGSGSGTGGGSGSGTGTGVGNDSGPGGGGGTVFPPQLQGFILPPPGRPGNLRGAQLAITFRISEKGEVVDVEVDPPIRDRGYRTEFMDRMRRYTFVPAYTRDGRAVAAEYHVTITL